MAFIWKNIIDRAGSTNQRKVIIPKRWRLLFFLAGRNIRELLIGGRVFHWSPPFLRREEPSAFLPHQLDTQIRIAKNKAFIELSCI